MGHRPRRPRLLQHTTDPADFVFAATFTNGTGIIGGGTDRISAHLALPGPTNLITDLLGSTVPTVHTGGGFTP